MTWSAKGRSWGSQRVAFALALLVALSLSGCLGPEDSVPDSDEAIADASFLAAVSHLQATRCGGVVMQAFAPIESVQALLPSHLEAVPAITPDLGLLEVTALACDQIAQGLELVHEPTMLWAHVPSFDQQGTLGVWLHTLATDAPLWKRALPVLPDVFRSEVVHLWSTSVAVQQQARAEITNLRLSSTAAEAPAHTWVDADARDDHVPVWVATQVDAVGRWSTDCAHDRFPLDEVAHIQADGTSPLAGLIQGSSVHTMQLVQACSLTFSLASRSMS